jgi:hypothetical protein
MRRNIGATIPTPGVPHDPTSLPPPAPPGAGSRHRGAPTPDRRAPRPGHARSRAVHDRCGRLLDADPPGPGRRRQWGAGRRHDGRGHLLDPEQRVELTTLARAALAGRATRSGAAPTLVAGASGPTLAALHADVARLAGAGADLVLVLPPSFQPLTPQELVALHLDVAERAEVPTLLYHIPQLTGSPLTPEAVAAWPATSGSSASRTPHPTPSVARPSWPRPVTSPASAS